MRRTTLADLDAAGIAAAFNRVYQGYAIPVAVDAAWAERHAHNFDIDLAASPLWLDDAGQAVGLTVLGVREDRGWVGGFGLAPEHRGRGLGHELLQEVVATARGRGLRRLQLEVLVQNAPAIALYERGGFRTTRALRLLDGDASGPVGGAMTAREIDPGLILHDFDRLHPVPLSWQRAAASLAAMEDVRAFGLGDPHALRAAVLYQPGPDGAARIVDIATSEDGAAAAEALAAVLAAVAGEKPDQTLRLINEPEGSPVDDALARLGWRESGRQFEMELIL